MYVYNVMTESERKEIYDSIMTEVMEKVSPIIRRCIDQYDYREPEMFLNNAIDLYDKLEDFKKQLDDVILSITPKQFNEMCLDFKDRSAFMRRMFPQKVVNEIFNNTKEFKESFAELKKKLGVGLGIEDWQVQIANPFHNGNALARMTYPIGNQIYGIIIPKLNKNIPYLVDYMDRNGYYLIRCFSGSDAVNLDDPDSESIPMAEIMFAQKKPANIIEWVKQYPYLYHVTPASNMGVIWKYGLMMRKRESVYDIKNWDIHYPDRVYFICGEKEQDALDYAISDMVGGLYHLLRIDINKIPANIKVYSDPLLGENAVYVEQNIKPELIEDVCEFEINARTRELVKHKNNLNDD